jgi:3-ketosteroid 9alpha-monooxygenase subunit B
MSSSPETDPDMKVTVKRIVEGRVSNWINDQVREGDVLQATAPAGRFCLRDRETPIVAFSGGSGITPVISLIKTVLARTSRPINLLYANRDRDSHLREGTRRSLSALCLAFTDHASSRQHGRLHRAGGVPAVNFRK